jgi:hypothetical protein
VNSDVAIALITDFLSSIANDKDKPTRQNWIGLLLWASQLINVLKEDASLLGLLCKINPDEDLKNAIRMIQDANQQGVHIVMIMLGKFPK